MCVPEHNGIQSHIHTDTDERLCGLESVSESESECAVIEIMRREVYGIFQL